MKMNGQFYATYNFTTRKSTSSILWRGCFVGHSECDGEQSPDTPAGSQTAAFQSLFDRGIMVLQSTF
jgi:hypothetical protein